MLFISVDELVKLFNCDVFTLMCSHQHEAAVGAAENKETFCKDKEPFEKQLYKFMREKKTPIKRLPSLGFKEGQLDTTNCSTTACWLGCRDIHDYWALRCDGVPVMQGDCDPGGL